MKEIILSQGKVALVDDEDFEELNKYKWYFHKGYAIRNIYKNGAHKALKMHRVILKAPKNMDVDHKNRNCIDNRKDNIRLCTHSQNMMNVGKPKNNTSGFKGVSKEGNGWRATININKKQIYIGNFKTKELAYKAYCNACVKYHGEFSHT